MNFQMSNLEIMDAVLLAVTDFLKTGLPGNINDILTNQIYGPSVQLGFAAFTRIDETF